jgi:chaperonin GroEL (HSP60 family)
VNKRKEMLEDIAVLTGGEVISDERGLNCQNATLESLGSVARKLKLPKIKLLSLEDMVKQQHSITHYQFACIN